MIAAGDGGLSLRVLLAALRHNLWERLPEDQAADVIGAKEGVRESQVDGAGFVQAGDLFFSQRKVEASQIILQLLLAARPEDGNHVIRSLANPVDGDLRRGTSRFAGKLHQYGCNLLDPFAGVL